MKLLTKEIKEALPKLYSQENVADPLIRVKFFLGSWTWNVLEGEEQEDGDWLFFGYVESGLGPDCSELGYFTLKELEEVRGQFGLGVERDLYFRPIRLSEVRGG